MVLHLIKAPTKQIASETLKHVRIIPNFINQEQQSLLLKEIDRKWQGLPYQFDHWDGAIKNFRERDLKEFRNPKNTEIINQIDREIRDFLGETKNELQILDSLHILDLHETGCIEPHIDSIKFTGEALASLSLISESRLRLKEYQRKSCGRNRYLVNIKLEPGTLYIMKGEMRYDWTHEIDQVQGRRVSIMRRIKPDTENTQNPKSMFNFGSVDS